MKLARKILKITPKGGGSGFSDVSVNHDQYLADFVYLRKLPKASNEPDPSPKFRTSKK